MHAEYISIMRLGEVTISRRGHSLRVETPEVTASLIELEISGHKASGSADSKTAAALCMSPNTVRTHLKQLIRDNFRYTGQKLPFIELARRFDAHDLIYPVSLAYLRKLADQT